MFNDIELIEESKTERIFRCPVCNNGTITINKQSKKFYGYCNVCNACYIDYVPLPHQMDVHKSDSKLKLLIGGKGSAKSRAGVLEIIDHGLSVPNGRTLLMAQTLQQLSRAVIPVFKEYLPMKFVTEWHDTKQNISIKLSNGHEFIGYSSKDDETFRSMEITAFLLEEMSGINPDTWFELIQRLRNPAASYLNMPDSKDHFLGIGISNPSQGFIRDLLFTASKITGSPSIKDTVAMYIDRVTEPNPDLEAFLSSSRDNTFLAPGVLNTIINSLSPSQVRLNVDCIIEYAEGAVYPDFLKYVCDDMKPDPNWKYFLAHDPGIRDPSAVLLCGFNEDSGDLYLINEFYKTDKVLTEVANAIKDIIKPIPTGMLNQPLIDPSAAKRSQINARTYKQQMQLEHNLIFKLANNNIVDGIAKTRDMMYKGKIHIFRSCKNTIMEGCEYRYPTPEERKSNKNIGDKPIDKFNHLMDCLRYIVQDIPYNLVFKERLVYNKDMGMMGNIMMNDAFKSKKNKNSVGGYRI